MNGSCFSRRLATVAGVLVFALALPVSGDELVPFKGHAKGVVTSFEIVDNVQYLTGSATGQATQLGEYTRHECIAIDAGVIEGSLVFIAANGDRLRADISGAFIGEGIASGTYRFTGGCGRFANATGEVNFLATLEGLNFTVVFDGNIDF